MAMQLTASKELIEYIPDIFKNIREFKALYSTEDTWVDSLWQGMDDLMNDQFIQDATEDGVSHYEDMLGITPKGTDSLETRKFRILAKYSEQLPYTYETLKESLETLLGQDNFTLSVDNENYKVKVRIELVVKSQYTAVETLLDQVLPANLLVDLDLRYNLYETLEAYTYQALSAYTYQQLRDEVIENATDE